MDNIHIFQNRNFNIFAYLHLTLIEYEVMTNFQNYNIYENNPGKTS